jgi:hypothetical protein
MEKHKHLNFYHKEKLFFFSGKIPGPVNRSSHHYIKLFFKEGLDNNFVQIINEAIQNKKWENFSPAAAPSQVEQEWKDVLRVYRTSKEVISLILLEIIS